MLKSAYSFQENGVLPPTNAREENHMLPVVLFEETSPHDPMLTNSFDRLREGTR